MIKREYKMAGFFVAKSLKVFDFGGRRFDLPFDSVENWNEYIFMFRNLKKASVLLKIKISNFPPSIPPKQPEIKVEAKSYSLLQKNLFSRAN